MSAIVAYEAPKVRWTPERVDLLKQLAARGLPAYEIAETFGASQGAIATKMSKVRARSILDWTQRERIEELHAEGWRESRIAKQFGVSEGDVVRHLHKTGLKLVEGSEIRIMEIKRARFTPEDDARIRDMTAAGYTGKEIAAALGRAVGVIFSRRKRLGVECPAFVPHSQTTAMALPEPEITVEVVQAAAPTSLIESLAVEIAAKEARIAELQVTLGMMRALSERLAA